MASHIKMASGVPRQYTRRHQHLQQQLQPRPHRRRMTRSNPDQDDYGGASSKQPFPSLSPDDLAATTAPQDDDLDYDHNFGHDDQTDPEDEEHDFQSQYSQESQSLSETSSDSDEQMPDDNMAIHPFRQLTSSLHGPNAFAPPFYNRPPTPLPPSPSLTSLLRPPFSATTSRPTTPDGSDVETPDDTEAAVAKSARQATTVPRASPKVPTYEYYGFVLYLASSLAFCKFAMPQCFAERVRFTNIALI